MNYADLKALKTRPELFSAVHGMSDDDVRKALDEAPEQSRRVPQDTWITAVLAGRLIERSGK